MQQMKHMIDWHAHIIRDPAVMLGKPCIAGTRIPVEMIVRKIAAGETEADLLRGYPRLTKDAIQAALAFAADAVQDGYPATK